MRLNGLGRLGAALAILGIALLGILLYVPDSGSASGMLMDAKAILDSAFTKFLSYMVAVVAVVTGIIFWAASGSKGSFR